MGSDGISFREARREDLPAIVAMLADDPLGSQREDPAAMRLYEPAFDAIAKDANQLLVVAVTSEKVVGTMQLTIIPGLSRKGALRGQIESVRIARDRRGAGLGTRMIEWAIAVCRDRNCAMVQLATHRTRHDAHRFYERLGFEASHVGYKLTL